MAASDFCLIMEHHRYYIVCAVCFCYIICYFLYQWRCAWRGWLKCFTHKKYEWNLCFCFVSQMSTRHASRTLKRRIEDNTIWYKKNQNNKSVEPYSRLNRLIDLDGKIVGDLIIIMRWKNSNLLLLVEHSIELPAEKNIFLHANNCCAFVFSLVLLRLNSVNVQ